MLTEDSADRIIRKAARRFIVEHRVDDELPAFARHLRSSYSDAEIVALRPFDVVALARAFFRGRSTIDGESFTASVNCH